MLLNLKSDNVRLRKSQYQKYQLVHLKGECSFLGSQTQIICLLSIITLLWLAVVLCVIHVPQFVMHHSTSSSLRQTMPQCSSFETELGSIPS